MLKAFICGGLICVVGQVILNVAKYYGADKEMAASINCIVLILISIIRDLDYMPDLPSLQEQVL